MSLMMCSKLLPALCMSRAYSYIGPPSCLRRITSSIPKIVVRGVRISWDMFARNSPFAASAAIAVSFASSAMAFALRNRSSVRSRSLYAGVSRRKKK